MENNKKQLVMEFYEKLTYGEVISKIELDKAIEISIKKAYLTICRKLKRKGNNDKTRIERYKAILQKELKNLLTNSSNDYDGWHKLVCTKLVNNCKDDFYNFNYGVAQKLVNMSIKYLYCIVKDDDFEFKHDIKFNDFDVCHATLDHNILLAIKGFSKKIKYSKLIDIDSYEKYMDCQQEIRNYLKNSNQIIKSPFFWEFKMWNEIKK